MPLERGEGSPFERGGILAWPKHSAKERRLRGSEAVASAELERLRRSESVASAEERRFDATVQPWGGLGFTRADDFEGGPEFALECDCLFSLSAATLTSPCLGQLPQPLLPGRASRQAILATPS